MGRLPALVIIARHGARLDAADSQWHLTSPTPYDPPLTYGGWHQSRALGARIASLLRGEGVIDSTPDTGRRRRVIIHTSPYLRCVQTCIGISAGLAQQQSSFSRDDDSGKNKGIPRKARPLLRVDAVLGEWLNPDYFEQITPPPDSMFLLTSAKGELLKPGDYTHIHDTSAVSSFPGGWSAVDTETPLARISQLADALPRDRAASHSVVEGGREARRLLVDTRTEAYVHPIPSYAVSSSDPIPAGYVAHARDACLDVDYQWDSSREPLDWGSGGEYGEEWAAMHKRCRKALHKMLSWYRDQDSEDHDTVLVLVSHGAACNAFIGALTDTPVLMDVGLASLTVAVCKNLESRDGIAEAYDVRLIGSTDHLRPSSSHQSSPTVATPLRKHHRPTGSAVVDGKPAERTSRSSLGSFKRNSQSASPASMRTTSPMTPSGLWNSSPAPSVTPEEGGDQQSDTNGNSKPNSQVVPERRRGLWGSSSDINPVVDRDRGKRRWTVNDPR
ncbi:MAG: hypothetical protein M1823_001594 [Watsoniomyces obsoletus]|nr:MAG: hypothetical protein M1823_001594 [Watsoniomyces obsoletus]